MVVVHGTRLFDGDRNLGAGVVRFDEGGVIETVDAGGTAGTEADGADIVDLGDVTLLPGLIDCHQHLCFDGLGTLEEQVRGIDDAALVARAREAGQRALSGGVTTVRDLGDRGYVTLDLRDDPLLPSLLTSGPPITRPGGHCWYLGGTCGTDDELRRAVRERVERGCDVVKVMVTGGGMTPTTPMWASQFDAEALRLVVDEAERDGLPVAAHCHGNEGIVHALDAGAHSIEHCTFMADHGDCDPAPGLIDRVAASGVFVSATLGRRPGFPIAPIIERNWPAIRRSRRRLHELGGHVVVGTDAGINGAKPHDVLPRALEDLIESGMTNIEGLRALTSEAARACGVADRKGRLAPGYHADVIAVSGDPTTDASALQNVVAVWRQGTRVR